MTFILDMASGTEYQGEELSCTSHAVDAGQAGDNVYPQLQLAVVEATQQTVQPANILPGIILGEFDQKINFPVDLPGLRYHPVQAVRVEIVRCTIGCRQPKHP